LSDFEDWHLNADQLLQADFPYFISESQILLVSQSSRVSSQKAGYQAVASAAVTPDPSRTAMLRQHHHLPQVAWQFILLLYCCLRFAVGGRRGRACDTPKPPPPATAASFLAAERVRRAAAAALIPNCTQQHTPDNGIACGRWLGKG
jgi:hypothetical protein